MKADALAGFAASMASPEDPRANIPTMVICESR